MRCQLFSLKGDFLSAPEQQCIQFLQHVQARAKLKFHQQKGIDGNKLIGHKSYNETTQLPIALLLLPHQQDVFK